MRARVLAVLAPALIGLGLVGCPGGGGPSGGAPGGLDLAVVEEGLPSGWGTCTPALLGGGACAVLGEETSCSTWEHDHCCVCALLDGRRSWVCDGPHVWCAGPIGAPDGGVAVDAGGEVVRGCARLPISSQACSAGQLGESFACQPYSLAINLCCTCAATPDGTRWDCRGVWSSCPPPDLGVVD